jgi:hypothetical protein
VQFVLRPIMLGIIVWIVYVAPPLSHWPVWLSAAGWIAFSAYWGAAAKNAAPEQISESAQSRRVHELLMNGGLFLLFIPVPGYFEPHGE